jgi:hypothetical protein
MLIILDDNDVPHTVEQVAVYAPDSDTLIDVPVEPFDHRILPLQLSAVMVATAPSQHNSLSVVIRGTVGAGLCFTSKLDDAAEVPHELVHVTV